MNDTPAERAAQRFRLPGDVLALHTRAYCTPQPWAAPFPGHPSQAPPEYDWYGTGTPREHFEQIKAAVGGVGTWDEYQAGGALNQTPHMWFRWKRARIELGIDVTYTWQAHLAWLRTVFGNTWFTTADVWRANTSAEPGTVPVPPSFTADPASAGYTRLLGHEYAALAKVPDGPLCIKRAGTVNRAARWTLVEANAS